MEKVKWSQTFKISIFTAITTALTLRYAENYKWYILGGITNLALIFALWLNNRKK